MTQNNQKAFDEAKKNAVTEILDAAVTQHGLDTNDYLNLKGDLFKEIEQGRGQSLGLFDCIDLANMMVAQFLDQPGLKIAVGAIPPEPESDKPESKPVEKPSAKTHSPANDPKAHLLKLLSLLPPYLPREKLEHYASLIKRLPNGKPSETNELKTVGDVEYEIMEIIRKSFMIKFEDLQKKAPQLFVDEIELPDGKIKRVNMAANLRKQIQKIQSVRQFLSLKDLVARHVTVYRKRSQSGKKSLGQKLQFWKK